MIDEPLAYFITWTVYGTFLQGDARGWRKRREGTQVPEPRMARWRAERLKHTVVLLNEEQREAIALEAHRVCDHLQWRLWAAAVRSNHVHVVVHAADIDGAKARDQLKANCTRVLRERWPEFGQRPVWSECGDWQCINNEDDLEQVIVYVSKAQDRKASEYEPKNDSARSVAAVGHTTNARPTGR